MKYIFDIDGVLSDVGCDIDPEFRDWFIQWSRGKEYYIVTGSDRAKVLAQVGNEIVDNAIIGFFCMGNSIWVDDKEDILNQFEFTAEEQEWLQSQVDSSPFPYRTGNHFEMRVGSLNMSVVGRNANPDQRNEYLEWDKIHLERLRIVRELSERFPRLEATTGGNISIDICLKGCNKGQVLKYISGPVVFFGDRCEEGEIDYPLAKQCETFVIKNGYHDTWRILRETDSTSWIDKRA